MGKNHWRRFVNCEKVVLAFLGIGMFSDVINKELLQSKIPSEIIGYLFWLSLGLYLGFILCKHEYMRALKLYHEQQAKDESNKMRLFYSKLNDESNS